MSEMLDLQRGLGRVEGQLEALEARTGRIDRAMSEGFKSIDEKLDAMADAAELVRRALASQQGKSKGVHSTLTILGAAAMSVLSLIISFWGVAFGR